MDIQILDDELGTDLAARRYRQSFAKVAGV
jgi:hypothetical protein